MVRRGRRRIIASAVAAGTLVAGLGMAGLAAPAGAATGHSWWWQPSSTSGSSSTSSSNTCPTASGASLAFAGTLSNGVAKFGSAASVTGLTGTMCGLVNVGTLTATVQPANFVFAPTTTKLLGFLNLPTTITVGAPATAVLAPGKASGTYDTSMKLTLSANVDLLGLFHCTVGPMTPTVTTGTSGTVSGTPLTGSLLTKLTGTMAAGDFAVPAIQSSSTCPGIIAGISNLIMGLPLAAGKSTITTAVSLTPTLPASAG
ncbi:MAG: hypothetical protein M0Z63_13270 [Actinomycetota bacterium]|nr:hypothetical protein [Actinomycetota bacterium]